MDVEQTKNKLIPEVIKPKTVEIVEEEIDFSTISVIVMAMVLVSFLSIIMWIIQQWMYEKESAAFVQGDIAGVGGEDYERARNMSIFLFMLMFMLQAITSAILVVVCGIKIKMSGGTNRAIFAVLAIVVAIYGTFCAYKTWPTRSITMTTTPEEYVVLTECVMGMAVANILTFAIGLGGAIFTYSRN